MIKNSKKMSSRDCECLVLSSWDCLRLWDLSDVGISGGSTSGRVGLKFYSLDQLSVLSSFLPVGQPHAPAAVPSLLWETVPFAM